MNQMEGMSGKLELLFPGIRSSRKLSLSTPTHGRLLIRTSTYSFGLRFGNSFEYEKAEEWLRKYEENWRPMMQISSNGIESPDHYIRIIPTERKIFYSSPDNDNLLETSLLDLSRMGYEISRADKESLTKMLKISGLASKNGQA